MCWEKTFPQLGRAAYFAVVLGSFTLTEMGGESMGCMESIM